MLSQIIQRQVPIGSRVTFSLKNGSKISGILIEIGRDHVTVESDQSFTTILLEMIGAWQVLREQPKEGEKPPEVPIPGDKSSSSDQLQNSLLDTVPVSSPSPSGLTEPEILRKLLEIEASFQAQLQTARIELRPPDFTFPADELKGKHKTEILTIWNRIKDRYEYAVKINELSGKFGRIQPIINELRTLSDWFPNSTSVKIHLAYFYWLSGNRPDAIKCYLDAAIDSGNAWSWYNAAVIACESDQWELACYCLEQFFHQVSVVEMPNAWYLYIRLLKEFSNYRALFTICEIRGQDLTRDEERILLETGIYLLKIIDREKFATELVQKWIEGQSLQSLAVQAFKELDRQPSPTYWKVASELNKNRESVKKPTSKRTQHQPQGFIYTYRHERKFGFLRGVDGNKYFFDKSAIIDDELLDKVNAGLNEQIPVVFEATEGPKGPVALRITLYRTIDEMFELAIRYANDGEYHKAIAHIKKVLEIDPEYPAAQESYEKWREYARITGVPKGSNPFARAKRVQLVEKDLDRAAQLFRIAIDRGDNVESAVKDLASLLAQQGKPQEAVDVLLENRDKIRSQQSFENMLVNLYRNAGQYDQAVALFQRKLEQASTKGEKVQILCQIANTYLKAEDYAQAERNFRTALKLQPDNKAAQRKIAICLFKLGRFEEAEETLNRILDTSPDAKSAELLEAIHQAKATGHVAQIDDIIIETMLSDFSRELSGFTQFFLNRCDFQGVPPDRVQVQSFNRADIQKLEELATQLGTRRPRDRAAYYLSAAKIVSILGEEDSNQFYKYLCRSFASMGDATVIEGRLLDAAREFYCEALSAYDGVRTHRKDEQDAVNALVRFLFSSLGQAQVPITPYIPSIDETIEEVLSRHPQRDKVFDAISYLIFRSRYAANRILNRLYGKSFLQAMALEYLNTKGISVSGPIKRLDDFVRLWNELRRKIFDEARLISSELRFLAKVELTTASIEDAIERTKGLSLRLFFDLDQQRVRQLQQILESSLDLCKQVMFEEKERMCIQISSRCQELFREIENCPTKLSVEEIYPVVQAVQKKVNNWLEEVYQGSTPQLSLRLPVESYSPDSNQQIEVQIVVENRMGCSPAEALELIIQEDEDLFVLNVPEIKLDSSLRGGDQQILKIPIHVSDQALRSQTFSVPIYAQYRTRSGEIVHTPINSFSIRLYSEEEFQEIANPYAAYAEGGVVGDPDMFYGREELIENVARVIQESRTQSKCIVIFGQKRAGKSSILHHLKVKLQERKDLLVLDLGNIGSMLDEHSSFPLLYQILWCILRELKYTIEDRISRGFCPLGVSFPIDSEFYVHPSPLVLFKEIFERYKRSSSKLDGWRDVRTVLLIDEFSYIYEQIIAGRVPESFMKNWKALLQENYFSAVLVGQDVMPKFKERFPNEFGTIQDERVSYLKREDAIKLIDEPIRIGGRQGESRFRERAIERIINLTAGSPFYIQIVCNRLVEYMNRKRARLVTEADVEQVKNELIRGVNALGLDKFDNLINSGDTSEDAISDEDALKVLTEIAVNSQTGPCSRNSIACETDAPLDVILDDLVKREVVVRERGQYYSIRVGLFKEWLVAHQ